MGLLPLSGHAQWSGHNTLGGKYGFGIWLAFTSNALEGSVLGLDTKTSTGLADLYIQSAILGWSKQTADFTAGIGTLAPTGDYRDFLLGHCEDSGREGFVVYMGNDVFGVKWRNWKPHFNEQGS